jgi:hypothetical protein
MHRALNVEAAARDAESAARAFAIDGNLVAVAPYGSGHINDSYRVLFDCRGQATPLLLQRINHRIFKDPVSLMGNIERVTTHVRAKLSGHPDAARRVLTLIPTRSGVCLHVDEQGNYWRAYLFVERTATFDSVQSPQQAFQAGKAFGEFQHLLADLPAPRLHDTIPNFHHTPSRFAALEQAIAADPANRASSCRKEIEFALARRPLTTVLLDANLPERVTHNDTKINNLLFDDTTGESICVIDLDTVMPGLSAYDFGDLVRTATCPVGEDERDLALVKMQFPLFEALARGYLTTAGRFLTAGEKRCLPIAGNLITFEIAIRFLTDHLNGDVYFKVHRQGHNLDRARTQFKLLESLEQHQPRMERLVQSIPV